MQFLEEMPIDFYKAWSDEKIVAHLSKLWQEITSKISSTEEKQEIPVIKCIVTAMQLWKKLSQHYFHPAD